MTVTLRRGKGSALTADEFDDNHAGEYNQTTHGFAVGDVVYRSSNTAWAKAVASAAGTLADGIVMHVEDADNVSIATSAGAVVTATAHGLGSAPQRFWLDQSTAGAMTATKPGSGHIQELGRVIDANTVMFRPDPVGEFV